MKPVRYFSELTASLSGILVRWQEACQTQYSLTAKYTTLLRAIAPYCSIGKVNDSCESHSTILQYRQYTTPEVLTSIFHFDILCYREYNYKLKKNSTESFFPAIKEIPTYLKELDHEMESLPNCIVEISNVWPLAMAKHDDLAQLNF